jgi:hypothetical protein
MSILAIVKFALMFADKLMGYLSAQQQQEAGAAMATAKNLQRAQEAHRAADAARAAIADRLRADPAFSVPNDPNRRD